MIVDNFNFMRMILMPEEADAPLVIDPNAVLPVAVALERLEMIAGRDKQVRQPGTGIEHSQLSASNAQYIRGEALGGLAQEHTGGAFAAKALDHTVMYGVTTVMSSVTRDGSKPSCRG